MNKLLIHITFCFIVFLGNAQDKKEKVWENEREYLRYEKSEKYDGPEDWYGTRPSNMKEDESYQSSSGYSQGSQGRGIQYSPQQIQRDRDRYKGFDRGGGSGTLKHDPKVERPDPITVPDIDAPDVDVPDIDIDAPTIPEGFWKFLLFLIIFAAAVTILYLVFKNRRPSNKKIIVDVEDEWNPEVVTKSELQLRLEEATERDDFRECVRIYFTFILKELIRKGWIRWKKEKTNHHYVMEMAGKPKALTFMECVRIYDLVWYGEYYINKDIYELLRPELENYYRSLEPGDE